MSSFKQAVTSSPATESFTGRVKWFNNKAGYGFITITDGTRSGTDVFAHHSSISVSNQQSFSVLPFFLFFFFYWVVKVLFRDI